MLDVALHPATADRFEDALAVLRSGGGAACCCQYWRISSSKYGRSTVAERCTSLRVQTENTPAPGMLAYVQELPAGWCVEDAGFHRVMETAARSARLPRWLMRLDLHVSA